MTGCDDVASPPAFDPFLGINFPTCVIKHGVDGHEHEHKKRHADMERQNERKDGEEPR